MADEQDVLDAAHAYERALTTGDTATASAFFDDDPRTSRFGPEGAQLDLAAVQALRAATAPTPTSEWVHDSVRMVAPGVAIHLAILQRGGATIQRTQVWVQRPAGWRIAHAHVARLAAPVSDEGTRVPVDTIGAFVGEPSVLVQGVTVGPLAGTTLAVKDLFDVAGTVTGAGNPTFAEGRAAATSNAAAVDALVAAGATVVGKTVTDELAYSLSGSNVHYGTPRNMAAPGRLAGGSSAGSAAAVAAGLVDLALGTDTGGSIRVPASYCGIFGWRPTHGAVSAVGVVPLAPSFDTMGLFARDPHLLATAADVLLAPAPPPIASARPLRLTLLAGTFDGLEVDLAQLRTDLGIDQHRDVDLGIDLEDAATAFRALQGYEAWACHGAWITSAQPVFGADIAARFRTASAVTQADVDAATSVHQRMIEAVRLATADGTVLVMPAAGGAAPLVNAPPADNEHQRSLNLRLTCIAGLSGAPVVVAPWLRLGDLPLGVAFVGAPGADRGLLSLVASLST